MSIARHHAEWLSLVEVSGPFLSMPVLLRVFPQGLDGHDPETSKAVRRAHEEWQDNQQGLRPDPALHSAWVRFVLREVLGFSDELLQSGPAIPESLSATIAEHGEALRPDLVIQRQGQAPRVLVQVVPPTQDLDKPLKDRRWKASPATRLAELLRGSGVRLGLLTNGERWMFVHAQPGETAGFASWYASLWLEERITLQAFRSLLSVDRLYGVADADTLEALLTESAANQQEVTDQLGYQVREAVEVLVQTLDRIDKDGGRKLLAGVSEATLYEAALTVMMRLVFLFSAEERELLLLGKPMYDQHYAVSTLRAQLRAAADETGEEVLERRHDSWSRLLATFRAVFGGVQHEDLRLPAYGGHLFDPDRFPFLEGRAGGTRWTEAPARPLPVDNRTVLHLLEALQILRIAVPGGGPAEPRRLSFRALDIEQIGHVYEGLLDHTAKRAPEPVLGLAGGKDREPEVALAALEKLAGTAKPAASSAQLGLFGGEAGGALRDNKSLIEFLREETGRSANALANALSATLEPRDLDALRAACDNDATLVERVRPFAGLLRRDTFGRPVVITAGSVYVTTGTDRRTSGTHYTPRSLTEPIVQHTLDPLVYHGPAEGLPKEQWTLHPAERILALQVCDMAMGSGAFLVQTCRYLAERLAEAAEGRTPGGSPDKALGELFGLSDPEERLAQARRLVADRCLYGVDKNPLAVEMAKLSLWLITLQKDRPFSFLDHALRAGDSLLGIAHIDQLLHWSLAKATGPVATTFLTEPLRRALQRAMALRRKIRETPVIDVRDAERKAGWLREVEEALGLVRLAADLLVAATLHPDKKRREELSDQFQYRVSLAAEAWETVRRDRTMRPDANRDELEALGREAAVLLDGRRPFHWPLEFPEVFLEEAQSVDVGGQQALDGFSDVIGPLFGALEQQPLAQDGLGFAAIVGNPPFQWGMRITTSLGQSYYEYLKSLVDKSAGTADLCAYFIVHAYTLLKNSAGFLGMIATNTISQGDTRELAIEYITDNGGSIYRAIKSRPWPGSAAIEFAVIHVAKSLWIGVLFLDDSQVDRISRYLDDTESKFKPSRLTSSIGKAFIGHYVMGMGFVLQDDEVRLLLDKNSSNADVIFPFLNGLDVTDSPTQTASRWAINFGEWDIDDAANYTDCFSIVQEKVKPERDLANRKANRERWWRYAETRPGLMAAIKDLDFVFVQPSPSKYMLMARVPSRQVFAHPMVVFSLKNYCYFSTLLSNLHETWVRQFSSTLENRMRYTPSDCFETFPFPASLVGLDAIGEAYHEHRQQVMLARQEGLTKTYNRFHSPDEASEEIAELRRLHVAMDQAVAAAYGWGDLDLGHGFHQTKQGLRYTISEAARRTVLDRLLALNHQRYAEEVAEGLHDKGAKKAAGAKGGKGRPRKVAEGQGELF